MIFVSLIQQFSTTAATCLTVQRLHVLISQLPLIQMYQSLNIISKHKSEIYWYFSKHYDLPFDIGYCWDVKKNSTMLAKIISYLSATQMNCT